MTQTISFIKTRANTPDPYHGSIAAAGWDLYAVHSKIHFENSSASVGTGIAAAVPEGHVLLLFPRSGLSNGYGLAPGNCVGVIDSDYRGEIIVKFRDMPPEGMHKLLDMQQSAEDGRPERIIQAILVPIPEVRWELVEALDETERGSGGFGSTGVA